MAKKTTTDAAPVEAEPIETPAVEPEPKAPPPDPGLTVNLKDENENATHYSFTVDPSQRDRKYLYEGSHYAAARVEADGSWTYRKETH